MKINFYTDGSSRGNPGKGGWGVFVEVIKSQEEKWNAKISGSQKDTTNNRMELQAVIESIKYLKNNFDKILKNTNLEIRIKMDSQYVRNGITNWIFNWEKNNWKTANKKEVLNKDLWQELLALKNFANSNLLENGFKEIEFEYVKGHAGIIGNEIADQLATSAADSIEE